MTALAPRATAFTPSLPRRTPPSSSTSTCSPTASATAGRARMAAGVPSRLLPPWLDTEIAVQPASTARLASSTRMTPLSMKGPPHSSRIHLMSSHVAGGVPIHEPYAPKNVGACCPLSAMFGTVRSGIGVLLRRYDNKYDGRVTIWGDIFSAVFRSIDSGIVGLPQSRQCEDDQSRDSVMPAAPAAPARSNQREMSSRLPIQ